MSQGDEDNEDTLMQDNNSCVLEHKNYPLSIGKVTKHAHVRFFFVVEQIEKKEAKVECCPTEKMIADYNSKYTQVSLFFYKRNVIQGVDEKDILLHKR